MTAPIFRRLDQLTGDVAESPVGAILDTADQVCAELAEVYELRTRVQELEAENAELSSRCGFWKSMAKVVEQSRDEYGAMVDQLIVERNALAAERDDLAERLDSLTNAHRITLAALAQARRGNTEPWHGQAVTE